MLRRSLGILCIAALFFVPSQSARSQSLNESLSQLSEAAAKQFVQPAFDPFGVSLNGGWLGKSPKANILSFDLEFGAVAMGTFMGSSTRTFEMSKTYRFSAEQARTIADEAGVDDPTVKSLIVDAITKRDFPVVLYGPTIIGSSDRHIRIVFSPNGNESLQINDPRYPFPVNVIVPSKTVELEDAKGLMDGMGVLPSAAPQLKIGTVFGTQAILRFVPSIKVSDDLGKFNYLGFGLQHNPNVWLNLPLPVDVSFGFLIQKAKVGDVVDVKGTSYGINVSKTFGTGWLSVTPYVGGLIEKSSIDVNYDQTIETVTGTEDVNIAFSLEGINKSRLTAGARFHIGVIDLAVDYNIGKMNSVTSGFFFSF
ncbi:MAG: DUF6588 family protein [Acidobacteriota bacterium]